jgi:histidinol-phosphate aminotransferase
MRTFAEPGDSVAWHPPSFELVNTFAKAAGLRPVAVPLRGAAFDLDVEGLVNARARITFLLRPNNPTGNAFARRDVERVLDGCDGLVVLDEAYGDFCGDEFAADIKDWPNLLVTRTLSKAQALAGLRVGYALAQEPVIQALKKVRGPYRLNAVTEHVASVALERSDISRAIVDEVRRERPRLETELRTRGFAVNASEANFVFFKPPVDAARLHQALMDRGIAVRKFRQPEVKAWLRATVGPAWVTQRFLRDLDDALREVGPRR